MEQEQEQPTPQNTIATFDMAGMLMGVCTRTPQDQPYHRVSQLAPEKSEHISIGFFIVMLLVELLDGVRELFV
jgi:hypothetical protein